MKLEGGTSQPGDGTGGLAPVSQLTSLDPDVEAILIDEIHTNDGRSLREIAAEVATATDITISTVDLYDALAGDPKKQSSLVNQLIQDQDIAAVAELVGAARIQPFLEDPTLTAATAAALGEPQAGELVSTVLKYHRQDPEKFSEQLIAISSCPEILAQLPSQGYEPIRSYLGFDKVAASSLERFDRVVAKTEAQLTRLFGDADTARSVVSKALEFPEHRFRHEAITLGKQHTGPFIPEKVEQDVKAVQKKLQGWYHFGSGAIGEQAVGQMSETLKAEAAFKRLNSFYQHAVLETLGLGAQKAAESLQRRFDADCIGHNAEVLASQILIGMPELVREVARSNKFSTADAHGQDLMVKLQQGNVVYLDVKASDAAADEALQKRLAHANTSKPYTHPDFTTRPSTHGKFEVFRAPGFVVVNPRVNEASAIDNLLKAMPGYEG